MKAVARPKPSPRVRVVPDGNTNRVEVLIGDRSVSRLWIHDLLWRIGSARLRMGGIGGVGTDPEHRKRGYSRLCLERACAFMLEEGYDMSALFGIANYYPRWGFASAMAEPSLRISTRQAEESVRPAGVRAVPFRKDRHSRAVLRIYEKNNRLRSGSLVRPRAGRWVPFRMGSGFFIKSENFVVTDGGGRVLGYASHDRSDDSIVVAEAGCDDPRAYPAVVAELARRGVARRAGELAFNLPHDDPVAEYLHRWNVEHRSRFAKCAAGMARMICVGEALRKCEGEFARRVRAAGMGASVFSLVLATDLGSFTLAWRGGRFRVVPGRRARLKVRMPQDVLAQLLLGYRSVRDAATARGVRVLAGEAGSILGALFPKGVPYMFPSDRF